MYQKIFNYIWPPSSRYHSAKSHFAICHFVTSHFATSHSAVCHFADCCCIYFQGATQRKLSHRTKKEEKAKCVITRHSIIQFIRYKKHFNRSVPLSHQGNSLPRVILPRVILLSVILLSVILLIVVVQTFEVPLQGNWVTEWITEGKAKMCIIRYSIIFDPPHQGIIVPRVILPFVILPLVILPRVILLCVILLTVVV